MNSMWPGGGASPGSSGVGAGGPASLVSSPGEMSGGPYHNSGSNAPEGLYNDVNGAGTASLASTYTNGTDGSYTDLHIPPHGWGDPSHLTTEEIDDLLIASPAGVEHALDRAKAWGRYSKELITYAQRRLTMEVRHATEMKKLNDSLIEGITGEKYLPLKSVFMESFKHETELNEACSEAMKQLVEWKFIKPLDLRRQSHEKRRRDLKDLWQREVRSLRELELEVEKAEQMRQQRENSFKKVRDNNVRLELQKIDRTKIEKGRKIEETAMKKKESASMNATESQNQLKRKYIAIQDTKAQIIKEIRELIYQCDQTTKACTVAYFQALATLWSTSPVKYQALSDTARAYLPGAELRSFVQEISAAETSTKLTHIQRSHSSNELSDRPESMSSRSARSPSERPQGGLTRQQHSFDSMAHDDSPTLNPNDSKISVSSLGTPSIGERVSRFRRKNNRKNVKRRNTVTINPKMHRFVAVRKPGKCEHCSIFSVLHSEQCQDCGILCHKACTEQISSQCLSDSQSCESRGDVEKEGAFGVSLKHHLTQVGKTIPPVLFHCVKELDKRGCRIKGLYRVPGVLSQVETVTADFDQLKQVNVSNVHPNVLASVVKLYIKQLPETLLTSQLYPSFIQIAKATEKSRAGKSPPEQASNVVRNLKNLVNDLPVENYDTLRLLLLHLKRLTNFQEENQMTATNLGIIFGPTLMHNQDGSTDGNPTIASMLDMPLQNKVTELLITHAYEIFDVYPGGEYGPDDCKIAEPEDTENLEEPSPGYGQGNNRNSSATPDLLKNRPPSNMQHSPGSSLSDANSEETALSGDDVTDVRQQLINQSRAIVREFQPKGSFSGGSSRENSMPPGDGVGIGQMPLGLSSHPGAITKKKTSQSSRDPGDASRDGSRDPSSGGTGGSSPDSGLSDPPTLTMDNKTRPSHGHGHGPGGSPTQPLQGQSSSRFQKTSSTRTPVRQKQKLVILRTNSIATGIRPKSEIIPPSSSSSPFKDPPVSATGGGEYGTLKTARERSSAGSKSSPLAQKVFHRTSASPPSHYRNSLTLPRPATSQHDLMSAAQNSDPSCDDGSNPLFVTKVQISGNTPEATEF